MEYYTETKSEVTDRITDGRTEFFSKDLFDSEEKAEKCAKNKRSYIYPVFSNIGIGLNRKFEFIGFGVPQ